MILLIFSNKHSDGTHAKPMHRTATPTGTHWRMGHSLTERIHTILNQLWKPETKTKNYEIMTKLIKTTSNAF